MDKKNNQKVLLMTVTKSKGSLPDDVVFQYYGFIPHGVFSADRLPVLHYSDEALAARSNEIPISEYMKGISEKVDIAFSEYQRPVIIAVSSNVLEIFRGYFKKEEFVTISQSPAHIKSSLVYLQYQLGRKIPTTVIRTVDPLLN